MKRVLITGANSYVGTNVEKWLMKEPENFYVETLDMRDPNWKNFDFSKFDVVFHVAGIAHVSTKKSMKDLYFKVNRDLTIETAIKAKESGVKQFIFMSSMIVYNSKETRITKDTKPNPDNFYGLSKLQAEEGIFPLQSETFNVVVLRPPMIYGPNSKGNFLTLIKITNAIRVIPKYINRRSVLFINNLSIIVKHVIEKNVMGVFVICNDSTISTAYLIKIILFVQNKKSVQTSLFNPLIKTLTAVTRAFKKVFGDFYYICRDFDQIELIDFEQSIKESIQNE